MAMKEYTTFPRAPGLESHYQMQFSVISRTVVEGGVLTPLLRCSRRCIGWSKVPHEKVDNHYSSNSSSSRSRRWRRGSRILETPPPRNPWKIPEMIILKVFKIHHYTESLLKASQYWNSSKFSSKLKVFKILYYNGSLLKSPRYMMLKDFFKSSHTF